MSILDQKNDPNCIFEPELLSYFHDEEDENCSANFITFPHPSEKDIVVNVIEMKTGNEQNLVTAVSLSRHNSSTDGQINYSYEISRSVSFAKVLPIQNNRECIDNGTDLSSDIMDAFLDIKLDNLPGDVEMSTLLVEEPCGTVKESSFWRNLTQPTDNDTCVDRFDYHSWIKEIQPIGNVKGGSLSLEDTAPTISQCMGWESTQWDNNPSSTLTSLKRSRQFSCQSLTLRDSLLSNDEIYHSYAVPSIVNSDSYGNSTTSGMCGRHESGLLYVPDEYLRHYKAMRVDKDSFEMLNIEDI